jgi:hypothetical protein
MSNDRLMGVETEYAIAGVTRDGVPLDRSRLLQRLMDAARDSWRCLPSSDDKGIFTTSGARFYIDAGGHPEWCAAESLDLREAVAQVKAGECLLNDLVRSLEEQDGDTSEIWLFRSNVDLSGAEPNTWGQHESYLTRCNPNALSADLIPHLVSRVFAWAGGFNPLARNSLEYCLFPRAFFFAKPISDQSTHDRGIFHVRDESLAGPGFWRLHIICGESLHSETALWLKLGTTALVVAMAEAGLEPGRFVVLENPVQALHQAARNLQHPLALADGRMLTALDLQEHYLELAEWNLDHECMPPFAPDVCSIWRKTLDGLRTHPRALSKVLDWPFKAGLFEKLWHENGIAMATMSSGNEIERRLYESLEGTAYEKHWPDLEFLIGPGSPVLETAALLTKELRKAGLTWGTLAIPGKLRQKMLEIDLRLGQLGPNGLFHRFDRAGMLEHKLLTESEIEMAKTVPPAKGRAAIRGKAVRELHGHPGATCSWQSVRDSGNRRFLDLSDPFCSTEKWISGEPSVEVNPNAASMLDAIIAEMESAGRATHA